MTETSYILLFCMQNEEKNKRIFTAEYMLPHNEQRLVSIRPIILKRNTYNKSK